MKQIVVNDTNIFIDLHNVGLLEEFFHLPWDVHTTDFVFFELQQEEQKAAVAGLEAEGRLHVVKSGFDELVEINKLKQLYGKNTNVSLADCSVGYYAKQNGYILLSGDRKLRNSAMKDGVEVKVILYVFEYKEEYEIIGLNDLLISEYENKDEIYLVRMYYEEYLVGQGINSDGAREEHVMTLSEALSLNLKDAGLLDRNQTLLEWLRECDYAYVNYNRNHDLER